MNKPVAYTRSATRSREFTRVSAVLVVLLFAAVQAFAIADPPNRANASIASDEYSNNSISGVIKRLPRDQFDLWTSPAHLRAKDLRWLLPAAAGTALLIHYDHQVYNAFQVRTRDKRAVTLSNAGVFALAGISAGSYGLGLFTGDECAHEAGLLAAEAGVNAAAVNEVIKYAFGRNRPGDAAHPGGFFRGGSSFPSLHANVAWSMASVLAHEYPSTWSQLSLYGLATAVSVSRVSGRQHFPADVVVGSALGWATGKYVYAKHHDAGLDENIGEFIQDSEQTKWRTPSTYVPADDIAYPIFARLAAMGYIQTEHLGIQPWTREECARLTDEASSYLAEYVGGDDATARPMVEYLTERFQHSQSSAPQFDLDSVYFRYTGISGNPLRDSYHFGQTIAYDYGRPYWAGSNVYTGLSAHASAGPLVFYLRGEYQHAPAMPRYSPAVEQVIAQVDVNPVVPSGSPASDDFRLLEAYVGTTWKALRFTAGKQDLHWGPSEGAFLYSTNAEPIYMLRSTWEQPFQLPGFLGYMGKVSGDFFFGELAGHRFPRQPYLHGQKLSFKLTPNLELGFSRTTVMGGAGHPLTMRSFFNSLFSTTSSTAPSALVAQNDPGDRRGGFDFRYRLPGLRNWVTIYSDSLVDDDVSPLAAPRRAAFNPGVYLARFPGVPKLDLRVESSYTDFPTSASTSGQFMYFNSNYHDAYTNKGQIIGNVVGREGKNVQGKTTYWLSSQAQVALYFRQSKIAKDFIPGGGTQFVAGASTTFPVGQHWTIDSSLQGDQHLIPLIEPGRNHSIAATFQLTWKPQGFLRSFSHK